MARSRSMGSAPVGAVFRHIEHGLNAEEIMAAVTILVTREQPSSFAVTAGSDGTWDLRLSTRSQEYLSEQLGMVK